MRRSSFSRWCRRGEFGYIPWVVASGRACSAPTRIMLPVRPGAEHDRPLRVMLHSLGCCVGLSMLGPYENNVAGPA